MYRRSGIVYGILLMIASHAGAQMRNNITPVPNTEVARVTYYNQLWVNAFYESFPNDYSLPANATKKYPLIIFLHGANQFGEGSLAEMPVLLTHSLPKFIKDGTFPDATVVGGQSFQPIVFVPQGTGNGVGDCECDISNEIYGEVVLKDLNFAIARYGNRIDTTRMYVIGISKGGGWGWMGAGQSVSFAKRLAGLVTLGGASNPVLGNRPANIGGANLPVLSVVSAGDIWATRNQQWINGINSAIPAPSTSAILQTRPGSDHDVWTVASVPGFQILPGMDIYQWALSNQRIGEVLPVALKDYNVSASNSNGASRKATMTWSTVHEQNNSFFTIERSADGNNFNPIGKVPAGQQGMGNIYSFIDNSPLPGINYYRLSQTDFDGATKKFSAKLVSFQTGNIQGIKMYPNPVINDLVFEMNNNVTGTIKATIITTDGKILTSMQFSKPDKFFSKAINLASLSKGHYILKITGDNYRSTLRFVKE